MLVFTYFYDKMDLLRDAINEKQEAEEAALTPLSSPSEHSPSPLLMPIIYTSSTAAVDLTRSLILAVSVCYHARLNDREEFERQISQEFMSPLALSGEEQFRNEIIWYIQFIQLQKLV